ncbi:MAG: YkgJ family cysteine cluster protein [Thermodesulfobacteriota bacterium]
MTEGNSTHEAMDNRRLIGDGTFRFACHSGVACYRRCCHNVDMYLYPIDIVRLKNRLSMTSTAFLSGHTITAFRENPYFPNVMMKMSDQPGKPCAFLSEDGCTVYADRPYSCRAYPVEPAFFGDTDDRFQIVCYLSRHDYCLGHHQEQEWTAQKWMDNQQMTDYNEFNAMWAQMDSLFRTNPFGPEGINSPALKMAFMACYDIDALRRFVFESSFLARFHVAENRLETIRQSDIELLRLGFDWTRCFLFGQGPLRKRRRPE